MTLEELVRANRPPAFRRISPIYGEGFGQCKLCGWHKTFYVRAGDFDQFGPVCELCWSFILIKGLHADLLEELRNLGEYVPNRP